MKTECRVCCFTGHRPESFPWGNDKNSMEHKKLIAWLDEQINMAIEAGVVRFICGNALGVDTWAAEVVIQKKKDNPEIKLEIAAPFEGHNADEPEVKKVQEEADTVHVVSNAKKRVQAFMDRNCYMVDHSDMLIAVYDDSSGKGGGTKFTIEYARKKGIEVIQCQWKSLIDNNVSDD